MIEDGYDFHDPVERMGRSLAQVADAWRHFVKAAGVTADELGRVVRALEAQREHGSTLLARHRRRRHR